MVFEEKHSFGEAFQEWIETVAALNKNSSGHPAEDLPVNISMHVRVKPEQPNVSLGNLYLIRECLSGSDVKEHVVTVVQRRNVQAVEMQVCLFGKLIVQRNGQNVGGTQTPDRRHVLSVVKHALKPVTSNCIGGRSGNEINMKLTIAAGEHHRIRERLDGNTLLCARGRADDRYTE